MIRLVTDPAELKAAVGQLSRGDGFACRILSLCESYPCALPFVDYWVVTDDGGTVRGAVARCDASFTLLLDDLADRQEVSSFLHMAGAASVLCDGKITLDGFSRVTEGVVMTAEKAFVRGFDGCIFTQPDLRAVHALLELCAEEGFTPPPFEAFYLDLNHRLRHGTARVCGLEQDGMLAAVALTVAECVSSAVIGAVACHPSRRRRGCGTAVVAHLTASLCAEGKAVYLHRQRDKNAAFYRGLGFSDCGLWREYTI